MGTAWVGVPRHPRCAYACVLTVVQQWVFQHGYGGGGAAPWLLGCMLNARAPFWPGLRMWEVRRRVLRAHSVHRHCGFRVCPVPWRLSGLLR